MIGESCGLETDSVGEALGGGGQKGRGEGCSGHLEAWHSVLTPDIFRGRWGKADTAPGVPSVQGEFHSTMDACRDYRLAVPTRPQTGFR